ncbi:MAG: T9SS type A sorting domain-containing protein [Bacteroidota bacterium]
MRKSILINYFILITTFTLYGQTPELFVDYDQGSESSFNFTQIAYLGTSIILTVDGVDIGREPAIIKDGVFTVLKDIIEGSEDSSPAHYISYNGKVFFSARDTPDSYAVWETDGTEEGTQIAFKVEGTSSLSPRGFIIGRDGALYYTYAGNAYRTMGEEHELVQEGATFGFIYRNASYNYSQYKDGVAYLRKNGDYAFELYAINESGSTLLAVTEETGFFTEGFGLGEVANGIMFSLDDDDDYEGIYIYREEQNDLSRLAINGDNKLPSRRTIDLDEEKNIAWVGGEGYYLINGTPLESELFYERSNNVAGQGDIIEFAKYEDKIAFLVTDHGIFGPDYIMYYDDNTGDFTNLGEIESYFSNMITYKNFGIIADGTSNLFDPVIHLVDLEDGTLRQAYSFDVSSNETNSVRPIGVQDGYLYYIYNLDAAVGSELYRIKIDELVISSVNGELSNSIYQIKQSRNVINVNMDSQIDIDVHIYGQSGQLLHNSKEKSNRDFIIDLPQGLYFLSITSEKGRIASQIFIE